MLIDTASHLTEQSSYFFCHTLGILSESGSQLAFQPHVLTLSPHLPHEANLAFWVPEICQAHFPLEVFVLAVPSAKMLFLRRPARLPLRRHPLSDEVALLVVAFMAAFHLPTSYPLFLSTALNTIEHIMCLFSISCLPLL